MKWNLVLFLAVIFLYSCGENNVKKEIIKTENAPAAIGPYSQAVKSGNFLYISGQLGLEPESGAFPKGGFILQARQALKNVQSIVKKAGFKMNDIVQCQVFLTNLDHYAEFNTVYQEFFDKDFPARAVVEVSRLPAGGMVEVMAVAAK
jgi:2-iminobutanoate/2-iminopropanoate deaminase